MSNKIKIVKRLESLKNALELDDEDILQIHKIKLKEENDTELELIIRLLEQKADDEKIIEAIDDYIYGFKGSKLTPHQQKIFDNITKSIDEALSTYDPHTAEPSNNFFSLKGSAGVGKTFVTAKLVEYFIKKNYKVLLTTPTHKALSVAKYMINANNIHIPTKTLHSYLDIKLEEDYNRGTKKFVKKREEPEEDFEKNLDILIVDESSMVSNELLHFIEENLQRKKLKTVLFIGDQYQLPPVDEGQNGIVSLPKQYELTEIVRQAKNSYIKVIANELKECIKNKQYISLSDIFNSSRFPELDIFYDEKDFLDSFISQKDWYKLNKQMVLAFSNSIVDKQNRILRYNYWKEKGIEATEAILEGEILVFNKQYKRFFQNNEVVKVTKAEKIYNKYINLYYWECKTECEKQFKVIDPLYKIQYNKYLEGIANKASNLPDKSLERKKTWKHYFATKEEFADLKYPYSSTIHKSQGSTYEKSYINISSIPISTLRTELEFTYRLLYVAVTRASKDIKVLF